MRHIFAFIFCVLLFSLKAFSCEMVSPVRHTNPDGTTGGLVSKGAKVESSVFVGHDARICGQAWVEGNARILGSSVVKDDSWIRENSIIQERANVGGSAVVWGSKALPAVVSGDSKVYGNAKILAGTKISGRSTVYGSVTLNRSELSGEAKVCEGYILNDQDIGDDYFCSTQEVLSRATLNLITYDEKAINKKSESIVFEIEGYNFTSDRNVFQVTINGSPVDPNNISVGRSRLSIAASELIIDGENEISFTGRDEFGKKISSAVYSFIVGTSSRSIDILQQSGAESYKTSATFTFDGKEYLGKTSYKNGQMVIEAIPETLTFSKVVISGIGKNNLFNESFSAVNEIPSSITASAVPVFNNNILDFSQGLSGWSISHPEHVVLVDEGATTRLDVQPDTAERVELAKTFRLGRDKKGFGVRFKINTNLLRLYSGSEKVQVILASTTDRKIEIFDYTLNQLKLFKKNNDNQSELNVQIPKDSQETSDYTVLIRLLPNPAASLNDDSWLSLLGIQAMKIFIDFRPMNFSPYMLSGDPRIPFTTPAGGPDCNDPLYDVGYNQRLKGYEDNMPFFSVGTFPMLNFLTENRIFGRLSISGVPKSKIASVRLIGEQNGVQKFSVGLSKCSLEKLTSTGIPGQSPTSLFNISHGYNLVHHLFAVGAFELSTIDPTTTIIVEGENGESVNKVVGADISLRIEAVIQDTFSNVTFLSTPKIRKVLASPQMSVDFTYKPKENVDYYDVWGRGLVRTGGDKWIQPVLAPVITSLFSPYHFPGGSEWQINDMSKLNGGYFHPHKSTHEAGLDADVIFSEIGDVKFNLLANYTKTQWGILLGRLESFLDQNKPYNGYIVDYNLTTTDIGTAEDYVNSRLMNRCLGDRFVSLTSAKRTGSLVRNVPDHTDHYHVRFNGLDSDGGATNVARNGTGIYKIPVDADLPDFWFSLDSDGHNLQIEPRDEVSEKYSSRYILWRFQDRAGFTDTDLVAEYDKWPPSKVLKSNHLIQKPTAHKSDVLKYIYVTVGNKGTGWCVSREIEIDPTFLRKMKSRGFDRWTYAKTSAGFKMVFQGGQK